MEKNILKEKDNEKDISKDNKIRFENEEEGPIQIVLNKKEEIMEEKPLIEEENVKEEENMNKEQTLNTPPTTEELTPLEKVTAFATAMVKAITDGLIKAFVWITEIFKRRRRENEEIGEGIREEIREEGV